MTSLVARARAFAIAAHASVVNPDGTIGHKRKYTGEDYIVHPAEVAHIVSTVPHTDEMLAAAWLHDTVEDTTATIEEVRELFGDVVADLVADLTDVSKPTDGKRAVRKAIDLAHTANASAEAQTIKCCDLISNTKSIVANDANFAKVYLEEKGKMLDVLTKADPTILARARKLYETATMDLHLSK